MTSFTNVLIALEGKTIPSLKEKNQRAAEKWRQMPQDEKQQYFEAASAPADILYIPSDL